MKVIKYTGRFGSAEAQGIVFPVGVPMIVDNNSLAASLVAQPDFTESSLEELEKHGTEKPAAATPAAPKVATAVAAPKQDKE